MSDIPQEENQKETSPTSEKIELKNQTESIKESTNKSEAPHHQEEDTMDECTKQDTKTEEGEMQTKLKSDALYVEVIDKKEKEGCNDSSSTPVPTPRRINKLRDHSSNIFPAGCMGCR